MNASRAAVMVVGVNLIAVWAVAAAGGRMAPPPGAAVANQADADEAVGRAHSSLIAAAERLEAGARNRKIAATLTRDPFVFGGSVRPAGHWVTESRREDLVTEARGASAAALLPGSDIVLQGMAESQDGEAVVRTAILRAGSDLVLVTIGSQVGGRYVVVGLTPDAVELESLIDHTRRTCRMK